MTTRELPCAADPDLFVSVSPAAHLKARVSCVDCDHKWLCRDVAKTNPEATGTFGGDLFNKGRLVMALGYEL